MREKKPPLGKRSGTVEDVSHELDAVKVDLQVQFDLVRFPYPVLGIPSQSGNLQTKAFMQIFNFVVDVDLARQALMNLLQAKK